MITSLFVDHKLNYFEALRRLNYWLEQIQINSDPGGHSMARRGSCSVLIKYANELWFDPFYMEGSHGR